MRVALMILVQGQSEGSNPCREESPDDDGDVRYGDEPYGDDSLFHLWSLTAGFPFAPVPLQTE